ncbi:hypothetical protein A6A20_07200 [Volucribacter amazonae]|uniref:Uncharacterized protein n=1 Tax=Volucribacter amazonae TaxID=256731 RepID=A0A9X4SI89_9PAST|nr:hypothetical protein [Volucribacter amazonae]
MKEFNINSDTLLMQLKKLQRLAKVLCKEFLFFTLIYILSLILSSIFGLHKAYFYFSIFIFYYLCTEKNLLSKLKKLRKNNN